MKKRGIILPYVMLFMVCSHLMYLGLLQLNQLQLQHFHQLQGHYMAQIQAQLLLARLQPTSEQIEQTLNEQLAQLLSDEVATATITAKHPLPQLNRWSYWVEMQLPNQTNYLLIVHPVIYLADRYQELTEGSDILPLSQYRPTLPESAQMVLTSIEQTLAPDWQWFKQSEHQLKDAVYTSIIPDNQWNFSTGTIQLKKQAKQELSVLNQVPAYSIAREQKLTLLGADYLIDWHCQYYQALASEESSGTELEETSESLVENNPRELTADN